MSILIFLIKLKVLVTRTLSRGFPRQLAFFVFGFCFVFLKRHRLVTCLEGRLCCSSGPGVLVFSLGTVGSLKRFYLLKQRVASPYSCFPVHSSPMLLYFRNQGLASFSHIMFLSPFQSFDILDISTKTTLRRMCWWVSPSHYPSKKLIFIGFPTIPL